LIGTKIKKLFSNLEKRSCQKNKIYLLRFFRFLFSFTFLILILNSCASRMPALYRDGQPLSIVEYEKIAQKEYENGHYQNSIKVYQALIQNYPEHESSVAWALYEIGYCYYFLEKYEEAGKYFRKVINEYQEPAAEKLANMMLDKIAEQK